MARIALLAPAAPASGPVADEVAALVPELREVGFTVDVVWPIERDAEQRVRDADIAVYHLADDPRLADVYTLSVLCPGLVVLHELSLERVVAHVTDAADPVAVRTRAEAQRVRHTLRPSPGLERPLRTPWPALVARRARGVIVFSRFAADYLSDMGCKTPIFTLPPLAALGSAAPRGTSGAAAEFRASLGGRVVVGLVGEVAPDHASDVVVRATESFGSDVVVLLTRAAGERRTRAEEAPHVRVVEPGSAAWLEACDVVVDVRYPHRGELSASVVRAARMGLPAIVRGVGPYLEWPEDAIVRLGPGPPRAEALRAALQPLIGDAEGRAAIGRRAREHLESALERTPPLRAYAEAVEQTLRVVRDPARKAVARWAGGLGEAGLDGHGVARGLGLRFVEAVREFEVEPPTA